MKVSLVLLALSSLLNASPVLEKRDTATVVLGGAARASMAGLRNRLAGSVIRSATTEAIELSTLTEGIAVASEGAGLAEASTALLTGVEACTAEASTGAGAVFVPITMAVATGVALGILAMNIFRSNKCSNTADFLVAQDGAIAIKDLNCIDAVMSALADKPMCETFVYDYSSNDGCKDGFVQKGNQCVIEKRDGCDTFLRVISDTDPGLKSVCINSDCSDVKGMAKQLLQFPGSKLEGNTNGTLKSELFMSEPIPFPRFGAIDTAVLKYDKLECNWLAFAVTYKGSNAGFEHEDVYLFDDIYAGLCPAPEIASSATTWNISTVPLSVDLPNFFESIANTDIPVELDSSMLGCGSDYTRPVSPSHRKRSECAEPYVRQRDLFSYQLLWIGAKYFGLFDQFEVVKHFGRKRFQEGIVEFMENNFKKSGLAEFNKGITCNEDPSNALIDAAGAVQIDECPNRSVSQTEKDKNKIVVYNFFVVMHEDSANKDLVEAKEQFANLLEEFTLGFDIVYDEFAPRDLDLQQVVLDQFSVLLVNLPKIAIPAAMASVQKLKSLEPVKRLNNPPDVEVNENERDFLTDADHVEPEDYPEVVSAESSDRYDPRGVLAKIFPKDKVPLHNYEGGDIYIHVVEPADVMLIKAACPNADIEERTVKGHGEIKSNENGHGTSIARLMCGSDYAGFAPKLHIVIWQHAENTASLGLVFQQLMKLAATGDRKPGAEGANLGLHVISQSLSFSEAADSDLIPIVEGYTRIYTAFKRIGVLTVVASANYHTDKLPFPAGLKYVVTVGASRLVDKPYCYSNYGSGLDLFSLGLIVDNVTLSGTSYAAPRVSAMLGIILGHVLKQDPMTAMKMSKRISVVRKIMDRSRKIGSEHPFWKYLTENSLLDTECDKRSVDWIDKSKTPRVIMRTDKLKLDSAVESLTGIEVKSEAPSCFDSFACFRE